MNAQAEKPFLTARQAAEMLGVDPAVVMNDVHAGMRGDVAALVGGRFGSVLVVYAWELEGPRLEMHRDRLGAAHREGVRNEG